MRQIAAKAPCDLSLLFDESQFCISGNCKVVPKDDDQEEFRPKCSEAHSKVPTKSDGMGLHVFMVLKTSLHIVSGTVKAMGYIEIPRNKLLPTARDLFGNQSWIFSER
ncbi:hypothetical protein TNCV_3160991 [Trichonephila clavipes]|nr:hypothetical protein TNCV_3160991 [Trichonephila clavipes]